MNIIYSIYSVFPDLSQTEAINRIASNASNLLSYINTGVPESFLAGRVKIYRYEFDYSQIHKKEEVSIREIKKVMLLL